MQPPTIEGPLSTITKEQPTTIEGINALSDWDAYVCYRENLPDKETDWKLLDTFTRSNYGDKSKALLIKRLEEMGNYTEKEKEEIGLEQNARKRKRDNVAGDRAGRAKKHKISSKVHISDDMARLFHVSTKRNGDRYVVARTLWRKF